MVNQGGGKEGKEEKGRERGAKGKYGKEEGRRTREGERERE